MDTKKSTPYSSWLARFTVQCIMQQATWLNTTSPKQMTFGVIWEVGHKFNRGKVFSVNSALGKLWHFPVTARGLVGMLPPCPSLRETILGWRRRHIRSISLCHTPQILPQNNFCHYKSSAFGCHLNLNRWKIKFKCQVDSTSHYHSQSMNQAVAVHKTCSDTSW